MIEDAISCSSVESRHALADSYLERLAEVVGTDALVSRGRQPDSWSSAQPATDSPIDEILRETLAPSSRLALTTPHEFQRRLDSQYLKQERRRFHEVPEEPSSFGHLTPTLRLVPVAAVVSPEHIASAECWCEPYVDYVDPDTGVAVYVHKEIQ